MVETTLNGELFHRAFDEGDVCGALYDFAGFISTQKPSFAVGSDSPAGHLADLVNEFIARRGFSDNAANIINWNQGMKSRDAEWDAKKNDAPPAEDTRLIVVENTRLTRRHVLPTGIKTRSGVELNWRTVFNLCSAEIAKQQARVAESDDNAENKREMTATEKIKAGLARGKLSDLFVNNKAHLFTVPKPSPVAADQQSVPEGFASQVIKTVRDRGNAYGSPAENHQTTANMWSEWLSRRLRVDIKLSAEDVCALNIVQKLSRAAFCSKDDTWLDVAGYTENVAMIRPDQRNHIVPSKKLDQVGETYNGKTAAPSFFKIGDIVRVVGEPTRMTVESLVENHSVQCVWFDGPTLHRATFKCTDLIIIHDEPQTAPQILPTDVVREIGSSVEMRVKSRIGSRAVVCEWFDMQNHLTNVKTFDIDELLLVSREMK